ncbi:hypothetical protein [Microbulbifer sp. DLAB2-AA]|uniref:hypothetical protein n=1 Tax=Microbulbifer sp. DLAB2-AA TaxID=3243394 RepID=UPI00403A1BB8
MKDLYSLNLSDRVKKQKNPFTGEVVDSPLDFGFDVSEKKDLSSYFKSIGADLVDADGFRRANLNGINIGFRDYGGLDRQGELLAIAFEYDEVNESVANLLFTILSNFNLVVRSGVNDVAHAKSMLPELALIRWKNIKKVNSAKDLLRWLEDQPEYY